MSKNQSHGRIINDQEEIDLAVIGRAIWDRIWLVILTAIFTTTLAAVLTNLFIAPTYQSGFTAFVNNKSEAVGNQTTVTNADTSASESLANTYAEILHSRPMLEATTTLSKQDYTYKEMTSMVQTKIQANTQLVDVTVTADNPESAYYLAKTISEIAPDYLSRIVEGTSMKIVSKPVLNTAKVGPSVTKNSVIGGILGLILAIGVILIIEFTDNRIKDPRELESSFGYSVIGEIPFFEAFEEKA